MEVEMAIQTPRIVMIINQSPGRDVKGAWSRELPQLPRAGKMGGKCWGCYIAHSRGFIYPTWGFCIRSAREDPILWMMIEFQMYC
jgi:hypothetical protein